MLPLSSNPHKKGEHVFNDVAGSIVNAFEASIGFDRARSLLLVGPYGPLSQRDLPVTSGWIATIRLDPILIQGRTLVAPASGLHDDENSVLYGRAKTEFQTALCHTVEATASLQWKRRPHRNSSFLELDPVSRSIISGIKDLNSSVFQARTALAGMIGVAFDKHAEDSMLSEKVSTAELARRRALIDATQGHLPNVQRTGDTLISTFVEELKSAIDLRIGHLD